MPPISPLSSIGESVIVRGEIGTLLIVSNTTQQAKIAFAHVVSIFEEAPALRGLITRQTSDTIELGRMRTAIRVLPASSVTSRGHSYIGIILEDFAFFECREDLSLTDTELLRALTPALLSTRGPLIMISSAFLAEGEFWKSSQAIGGPPAETAPSSSAAHRTS